MADCLDSFAKLKTNSDFQFVYKRGRSVHTRTLVLFFLPGKGKRKIGFTASKKVGNAVQRNRSKRRLRALFVEFCTRMDDGSFVFVAKTPMNQASYETLKRDFRHVLKRTGGLADDKKVPS